MSAAEPPDGEITRLLRRLSSGDPSAEKSLIEIVYPDLRRLAGAYLRRERPDHTLQPTALVNEAYMKLMGGAGVDFQDRSHFFRVAATLMRRILVDYARGKRADKRGGDARRIPFEEIFAGDSVPYDLILDVDRALGKLHEMDSRQAQVVEMRFFGGLSEDEIASALGITSRTVRRDWIVAKAWLHSEVAA